MDHAREQVGHVGGDLDLVQPEAVLAGQLAGVGQVVRHRLQAPVLRPERDRVAVDVAVVSGGQDGEQAGVQPAGQEGGDGHVGHQVRGHRVLEHAAQLLHVDSPPGRRAELGPRVEEPARAAGGHPGRSPATSPVGACGRPGRRSGPRGSRSTSRTPRWRCRRSPGAPRAAGRSPLSSEAKATPPSRAVQNSGLMPNWSRARVSVPRRSSNSANANMPRRRGRHAGPHRRHASSSTSVSELGPEADPGAAELGPQLAVVVDLAVAHQHQPVLHEGLVGRGGQVDDRQPSVTEPNSSGVVGTVPGADRVRPAVSERTGHGGPLAGIDREVVGTEDPAHGLSPGPSRTGAASAGPLALDDGAERLEQDVQVERG